MAPNIMPAIYTFLGYSIKTIEPLAHHPLEHHRDKRGEVGV